MQRNDVRSGDRIVRMTRDPAAEIAQIPEVALPRLATDWTEAQLALGTMQNVRHL